MLDAAALRLLWLVASGRAGSRMDLARVLDLPQSTVSVRIQALIAAGMVTESGQGRSQGGRRPRLLRVNADFGHVWTADVGSQHVRIGALDLAGTLLRVQELPLDINGDPETVMIDLAAQIRRLANETDCPGQWMGVAVGLPGPVDVAAGAVTWASRMPRWRGFAARAVLSSQLDVPVAVDNDANLLALGESRLQPPGDTLVVVKAGTGIGSGLVIEGRLHRGRAGVAGDISHVRVPAGADNPCSCGNRGCLETVASGAALVAGLRADGFELADTAAVMAAAEDAEPTVTTAVRRAGLQVGEVLATVVNFANPDAVLLGGVLSGSEAFVAAIRGALYERCLPLATSELRIDRVRSGADAGLVGAGVLALEEAFERAAEVGWRGGRAAQ